MQARGEHYSQGEVRVEYLNVVARISPGLFLSFLLSKSSPLVFPFSACSRTVVLLERLSRPLLVASACTGVFGIFD